MFRTDICIVGAGIIGLSLALELHARGLRVTVLEAGAPMRQASIAAAGMLAANDPHNPPELSALSHLSLSSYPGYLDRLANLGGIAVPFQTRLTLQSLRDNNELHEPLRERVLLLEGIHEEKFSAATGFEMLHELSIDPRQLAASLLAAVRATSIELLPEQPVIATHVQSTAVAISTPARTIEAAHYVDCTGAWAGDPAFNVVPIKGQMLAVSLPPNLPLSITVRTRDIYIVPRTLGPNSGRAIIGATVEDAGFDRTVHAPQIDALHRQASALLPQLAHAEVLESWSGLRPATPDRLPVLGAHPTRPNHWVATGHYRNGILLAPGSAYVMAQLLLDEKSAIALGPFSPTRHALAATPSYASHTAADIRPPRTYS